MTEKNNPQWANRIIGHGEEDPTLLMANPRNFRLHPKEQADALSDILQKVGVVQEVIVNKRSGFLLDGHLRVELAIQEAQPTIPVKYVDLTPEEEDVILLFIDRLTGMAMIEKNKLEDLVAEIHTLGPVLQAALAQFVADERLIPPDIQFTQYDESAEKDVQYVECPNCHHRWPK